MLDGRRAGRGRRLLAGGRFCQSERIKCIRFALQEEPTEIFPAMSKELRLDAHVSKAWAGPSWYKPGPVPKYKAGPNRKIINTI